MSRIFVRCWIVIGFASVALSNSVSAESLRDRFNDFVIDRELKIPFPKIEAKSGEWARAGARYSVSFMPHRDVDKYYRREKLNLSFQLAHQTGDQLRLSAGPSILAEFIRPFPRKELFRIKGEQGHFSGISLYTPKDAPHSAGRAINMRPGEFYSFTTKMTLGVSAGQAIANGVLFAGPQLSYAVSGDFRLTVYRLEGEKVKVVASSLKEKRIEAGVGVRSVPDIDVFAFSPANNALERLLEVNMLDWKAYSRAKGTVFSVSYEYDLSLPAAQRAYNGLLNISDWKWTDFKVINPIRNHQRDPIKKILKGKIELSEHYAQVEESGVDRDYVSAADYTQHSSGLGLNVILARQKNDRSSMEMDYQVTNGTSTTPEYFKIGTLTMSKKYRLFNNWRENDIVQEANVIFNTDSSQNIRAVNEMSFSYQRADVKLRSQHCRFLCQDEIPELQGQIRKLLPEAWGNSINLPSLVAPGVGRRTFMDLDIYYSPQALKLLETLDVQEIFSEVDAFMMALEAGVNRGQPSIYGPLNIVAEYKRNNDLDLISEMRSIKEHLVVILTRGLPAQMRWESMQKAQRDVNFRDTAPALFARLVEAAAQKNKVPLNQVMGARLEFQAEKRETQILNFGSYQPQEYNQAMMRDRERILNREFNPNYFQNY